ncbi:MAG TPA: outer membrane beta-barrel protein [Bryobacteraceae bacterium]|nr:outer membrane beta-barrel protein [Bryobacteraceae bacterium]
MMKTFSLMFVCAMASFAQPIGVGLKVGLPLTDAFDVATGPSGSYASDTKRYIIGPQVELRLPAGFAIELDALYTKLNFSSVGSVAGSVVNAATDADAWEFPLLLKKKFGGANAGVAAVRPFVATGAAFRRLTGIKQVRNFITGSPQETSTPAELRDKNATGFVIGGGVEIRALFLRISPEVRFTRWGTSNFREGVANLLETNRNQGQFLVGFHF